MGSNISILIEKMLTVLESSQSKIENGTKLFTVALLLIFTLADQFITVEFSNFLKDLVGAFASDQSNK